MTLRRQCQEGEAQAQECYGSDGAVYKGRKAFVWQQCGGARAGEAKLAEHRLTNVWQYACFAGMHCPLALVGVGVIESEPSV